MNFIRALFLTFLLLSGSAYADRNVSKDGTVTVVGSPASASNQELVAAQGAGVKIRVVSLIINAGGGANTVTFKTGTDAITPAMTFSANGGMVLERQIEGWFETDANEALNVTLSAATLVGMQINYILTTN